MAAEGVFAVTLTVQQLERQPLDDVAETARGVIFVAAPQPPRVGTYVQIDVTTTGSDKPLRLAAMVVWSRPGRPGVVAGFRAQLTSPPPELLTHIRDVAGAARAKIHQREDQKRSTLDGPVTERVRTKEVTAPMRADPRSYPTSQPPSLPPLAFIPEPSIPTSIPPSLPPHAFISEPSIPTSIPPSLPPEAFISEPSIPTSQPPSLPPLMFIPEPTVPPPAPRPPAEPTSRQRYSGPVRLTFSSGRNYLLHYEQFLGRGAAYISHVPPPPVGGMVTLSIEIPDGDAPVQVTAVMERVALPPEVPQPGWIARFTDPDGTVGERLTTATFIVGTPTTPPAPRRRS